MSEFTAGILFRNTKLKSVQAAVQPLSEDFRTGSLNEDWGVILLKDEYLESPETVETVKKLSEAAPLLHFHNAEDHGWGYTIFNEGRITASLYLSYEMEDRFFLDLAQQKYPDRNPHQLGEDITVQLCEEIKAMPEYQEQFTRQFKSLHLDQFRLFQVDVDDLEGIFDLEYIDQLEYSQDLVEEFKGIVEIQEMTWINFETDLDNQ
ncbi:hypothetical protein [Paenibacillus sp. y28]|uniref:hypothetical protein n=1 Tax=Paenibacillus sp. y28 TaxID=3129110 RepID=UPI00301A948A